MKLGIGTRYAAYQSVLMLVVATTALALGGSIMVRRATRLQGEIGKAIASARSREEDDALKSTAAYLSRRLFNPLARLDVERLTDEIRQIRAWLPVKSFRVADREGRVLADGSDAIRSYGEPLGGRLPAEEPWQPALERRDHEIEVRFAVLAGVGPPAGFAVMTLGEGPLSASLKRMDETTDSLWADYRASLLGLGAAVLLVTVALGGVTSARLSKTLVGPLMQMSEAARRYAAGDLEHALELRHAGELGELAQALDQMARDLREHERERDRLILDLESKNRELESFNYTASHDLRTPLVTIRAFVGQVRHALKRGDLARAEADLARVAAASQQMSDLLEDLLELSRIGRVVRPPEDFPLAEAARLAVELVRSRLDDKKVEVAIAPDLPMVRGDRQRITEALQNLVENAAKFTGAQAAPRVEIGWKQERGERVFYVEDNGTGFDERFKDRVFGLFEKLDPRSEGTGIGLALVRRIVEAHGGRIWAESAGPDRGATFCFTLSPPPGLASETRAAGA